MSSPDDLKNLGLKATTPRLKILEVFEQANGRHMTADDVHRILQDSRLDIGLATVYRALTQFEEAGLLERHHFETGKATYELRADHHHDHLVCVNCGRVEEFYEAEIERRQKKVAKEHGFAILEHALNIYAECTKPNCEHRKKTAREEDPEKPQNPD